MAYDGHGRLVSKHLPEYNSGTSVEWTYNADDSIATVTDPRDAETTYTYGLPSTAEKRALVTGIAYSVPTGSNIPDPADVSLTYDAAGNRTSMTDASGELTYAYDELSRLVSETKEFADTLTNAPPNGYKLEYTYHLTGGIKSIEDEFSGKTVTYSADAVGRMTGIGGSGFGVSTFASNIAYRAFGGVKSMAYSTTAATNITMTYDTALRPATFEAESSANTSDIHNKTYTYFNDGKIKEEANSVDSNYGQIYEYDFAARLTKNQFGTGATSPQPVYKQTLGYDAFDNITSRNTRFDGTDRNYAAGFTNNRKTSGGWQSGTDTFDAAGNVVTNHIGSTDTRTWKFDAAGRMTDWEETTIYAGTTRWSQGEELTFDGDGRIAKRDKRKRIYASPPTGWSYTPEYYLYSSVTGQVVTELDDEGANQKTNAYMGSTVIADYRPAWGVKFKTIDPIAGSVMQSEVSGEITPNDIGRVELASLGTVVPTTEPEITEPYSYGKGGLISNPEYGCVDPEFGDPMPCNLVEGLMNHLSRIFGEDYAPRFHPIRGTGSTGVGADNLPYDVDDNGLRLIRDPNGFAIGDKRYLWALGTIASGMGRGDREDTEGVSQNCINALTDLRIWDKVKNLLLNPPLFDIEGTPSLFGANVSNRLPGGDIFGSSAADDLAVFYLPHLARSGETLGQTFDRVLDLRESFDSSASEASGALTVRSPASGGVIFFRSSKTDFRKDVHLLLHEVVHLVVPETFPKNADLDEILAYELELKKLSPNEKAPEAVSRFFNRRCDPSLRTFDVEPE